MDKENLKGWSSCLIWILTALLLYKGCDWYSEHQKEKYRDERRNDSIRKAFISDSIERRKAFVADSLSRDPRYQDSVRQAEKEYKIWYDSVSAVRDRTIAGVMINGDSIYHTCFHDSLFIEDSMRLRFVSNKEIEDKKFDWCDVCRSLDVETLLEDETLIYREDAKDYIDDDY